MVYIEGSCVRFLMIRESGEGNRGIRVTVKLLVGGKWMSDSNS